MGIQMTDTDLLFQADTQEELALLMDNLDEFYDAI
jgi:hypothetical protein